MMEKIIIIGTEGHAKVIIDAIELANEYSIIGLIDDFKTLNETTCNYKVIGKIQDLKSLMAAYKVKNIFIAIGDNYGRNLVYNKLISLDVHLNFITVIHPNTIIAKEVQLGKGIYIAPGVIVNGGAIILDFAILNTNAVMEHDCVLGRFSSLGPMAIMAGGAKIGDNTAIGLNACVLEKREVGTNCIIGAGALVNKNIGNNKLAYGVPCKVIRERDEGEKYLW